MPELQSPIQQHSMSFDALSPDGDTGTRTMTPPPFQLMASPGDPPGGPGGKKKKVELPTNDHPVGRDVAEQVESNTLPPGMMREIEREVKDIGHLQVICKDVIIVHSPCYSAEILTIMDMVNKEEITFEEGKREILNRLAYLLTNEFKNADGETNDWAETNKGDGTVKNKGNQGADWYHLGEVGPQYIALTDWNDPTDPSQGANNYTIYSQVEEVDGIGESSKPFVQEHGDPLTSKDADGQGKGDNRAKNTGKGIDITWLLRYLGISKMPSKTAPKSGAEKSKNLFGPLKTITNATDSETRGQKDEEEKKKEELLKAKERKGANTIIQWQSYNPQKEHPKSAAHSYSLIKFRRAVLNDPNAKFTILSTNPMDPNETFYTKKEIENYTNILTKGH
jgi:hypothetical protein